MTLQEINDKIDQLKESLKNVKGTKTSVYSRIVGYYRALDNWNVGQREQYKFRKSFRVLTK
jgi:ribonucleoside-triphosphate reductase